MEKNWPVFLGEGAHLYDVVVLVAGGAAVETEGAGIAVEAVHVAFTPRRVAVHVAQREELRAEQRLQPRRCRHCSAHSRRRPSREEIPTDRPTDLREGMGGSNQTMDGGRKRFGLYGEWER